MLRIWTQVRIRIYRFFDLNRLLPHFRVKRPKQHIYEANDGIFEPVSWLQSKLNRQTDEYHLAVATHEPQYLAWS